MEQEVSSVSGGTDLNPTTKKRSIKTSVIVEDGQVLVLGGLIDESLNEQQQKVPFLGDIPIIGNLFRSSTTQKRKTNLMVFLHPRIIRDAATSAALTSSKYQYIRAQQLMQAQNGVSLMPGEQPPLIPKMDDLIKLPEPF